MVVRMLAVMEAAPELRTLLVLTKEVEVLMAVYSVQQQHLLHQ